MIALISTEKRNAIPPPNYMDPETRGNALTIIDSVFVVLALLFLLLRLYTRLFVRKWFGWDDVCICLAFASAVSLSAVTFVGTQSFGWKNHTYDIPKSLLPMSMKLSYVGKLLYILASMFIAFSFIAFYYRLISETSLHWFRTSLHALLVTNVICWTAYLFAEIFLCEPVNFYWSLTGKGKCINEVPVTFSLGIVRTVMDLIITSLPLPLILRTQMRRSQRNMVASLFALGFLVTAAGAARVYFQYKVFYGNGDITWWKHPAFVMSTIENYLAIVCACAPTIRPLYPKFFDRPLYPKFFHRPLTRLRGFISSHHASDSRSPEEPKKPAESKLSHVTRMDTRQDSFPWLRRFNDESDNDDIQLVIQVNNNSHVEELPRSNYSEVEVDLVQPVAVVAQQRETKLYF